MLKELIKFVDNYGEDTSTVNKKNDSARKFVMIKTNEDPISYNGLEVLSNDSSKIKEWLDKNRHYKDVLENIEGYVLPHVPNKALGSTAGLLTYCFFAFKLSEANLENLERKISKTKLGKGKKYQEYSADIADVHAVLSNAIKDLTKTSDDKYDFLDYYALVITDKKRLEKWNKITCDFIKERTSGGKKLLSIEGRCYVCNKTDIVTNPDFCTNYDKDKIFLKHVTRYSKDKKGVPLRVCGTCGHKIYRFESILKSNKIKIFPLFIFPNEIRDQVKLTKDNLEEQENRFSHIFDQLAQRQNKNIFDFYLVVDTNDGYFFFDHITTYKWNIEGWIDFYDESKNDESKKSKITRQQLELKLSRILNKKGFIQYFGKVTGNDNQQKAMIYSFRQKIFDFVYRNQNSLTLTDLQKIIIFRVERMIADGCKPKNEIFNLYFNASLIVQNLTKPNILDSIKGVSLDKSDFVIDSDEKWAYFAGQAAYYLVSLSESSKKTVALLEPFINKSTTLLVKETLAQLVDQYKHKINLSNMRFKRLITGILSYEINESFIKLKIPFYVGAFDENLMYQKGDKENE